MVFILGAFGMLRRRPLNGSFQYLYAKAIYGSWNNRFYAWPCGAVELHVQNNRRHQHTGVYIAVGGMPAYGVDEEGMAFAYGPIVCPMPDLLLFRNYHDI